MGLNETEIHGKVQGIMADFIERSTGWDGDLDADMSLIDGGLVDSISLIGLVSILQQEFDIEITVPDITIENFDNLAAISKLIQAKMDGTA